MFPTYLPMQILVTIGLGFLVGAGVEFSTFPLTCLVVLKTLCTHNIHPSTVPACDNSMSELHHCLG